MAKDKEPEKIKKEHLILCEGEDEKRFLIAYLDSKEKANNDSRFESSVQVWDFGGNEQLKNAISVVRLTEGYSKVKTMLIIRDAESNAEKAVASIKSALSSNGLSVPDTPGTWSDNGKPYTAFMLFPSLGKELTSGTLEHLCMKIIKDKYLPQLVLPQIDNHLELLKEAGLREFKHDFKSKLHSFFSVTEPLVGMKIGESAKAGAFDWNSKELNELNLCLMEGFNK